MGSTVRAIGYAFGEAWDETPGLLVGSLSLGLAMSLIPAGQVWLVAEVTAQLIATGTARWWSILAIGALVGLGQVAGPMSRYLGDRAMLRQVARQNRRFLAAVCALTPQELATAEINALIQGARSAVASVHGLQSRAEYALQGIVAAAAICVAIGRFSVPAALLCVLALVPTIAVPLWGARLRSSAWLETGEHNRRVGYAIEQVVGQRTGTEIATLGTGPLFARVVDVHLARGNRIVQAIHDRLFAGNLAAAAVTAALLTGALLLLVRAPIGAAGIAAGVVAVISGMSAVRMAGHSIGEIVSSAVEVIKFREFTDRPAPEPHEVVRDVERLDAEDLTVTYPGEAAPALDRVTMAAQRGEMVALVGPNGAGKTTLVNALLGVLDIDAGRICIDGDDASRLSSPERLGHFGLLSQEFGRYELTVREAVQLGTPHAVREEAIWSGLARAGIADVFACSDEGLATQLGQQWGGRGLSGGQWQRLALARIYLRDAGVWILDEPTSAVDAEAEQQVFRELAQNKAGRIVIVVSHRAWTLRYADRIYVLDEGRIVEEGTFDDLKPAGGRFAELFAEQFA